MNALPFCYGYIRWSSDAQEDGDSRARQEGLMRDWLKKNPGAVRWDKSLGKSGYFLDEGKSGHLRESLDGYALGEFRKLCQSGRVPKGSYLLFENMDRITREHPWDALQLIDSVLRCGIVLVQLAPLKEFRGRLEFADIVVVGATAERAFQESDKKRERCSSAWRGLKENAKTGAVMTSNVPAWCVVVGRKRVGNRYVGGEIKPHAGKAATVQRLYKLMQTGKGCKALAEQMNAERVPVVGRGAKWTEGTVYNILTNPAVHGEYMPHVGRMGNGSKGIPHTRKPTGETIPDYYPAIIDREQFLIVQDTLRSRSHFRGRRGKHINLFAGLLTDGRDGGAFGYRHSKSHPPTLIPVAVKRGTGGTWTSFSADVFDAAILSKLKELKAADVLPGGDAGKVATISALHTAKETEYRDLRAEIGTDAALLKMYRDDLLRLDAERGELATQLAEAQREAASPLAETWGEFTSVADMLKRDGSDDLRLRCRDALRRLIESVTVVFTGSKMTRRAAVRVQFKGGAHRDYLIEYTARNRTRKNPPPPQVFAAGWGETEVGELDLRNPADALRLEKELAAATGKAPSKARKRA
jgi:DNA invertase Pin-like site-specific DNA recombinase